VNFVGRQQELNRFAELEKEAGAKILVVYGRRRVGKTTLIKKAFDKRRLLTFEGLEGKSKREQLDHFASELAENFKDPKLAKFKFDNWKEAFRALFDLVSQGVFTIHLEEIQWMAGYREDLVSELKYVWDNFFIKNPRIILILCGSSPSFLINSVMRSKALHNRSQYEFPITELSFHDAVKLMGRGRSLNEQLDGYLAVGGIPEYCSKLSGFSSVFLGIAKNSFSQGSYFAHEAERVFVSSLAHKPEYRRVLGYLAKNGPSTAQEIFEGIGYRTGGAASEILADLRRCEFIYSYSPLEFGKESRGAKWIVRDCYLHLYYKLIRPKYAAIERGDFNNNITSAISQTGYRQWLGLAFERFCLFNHQSIARILGFSGVQYQFGPFYLRKVGDKTQIDLVFKRADRVLTVCEIKYQLTPPGREVKSPFERNLITLQSEYPKNGIQKVLISPNGAEKNLIKESYFDSIIELDELLAQI